MIEADRAVVKVIEGAGTRVVIVAYVFAAERGLVYTDPESIDPVNRDPRGVNTYSATSGYAVCDYIPGFRSYLIPFDGGGSPFIDDAVVRDRLAGGS